MIVDSVQLADIHGVNRTQIYNWIKEGCPVHEQGKRGKSTHKFDTAAVAKWHIKRAKNAVTMNADNLTYEEARTRKIAAEAELSELELAKKKALVADLEEVERELADKFAEMRSSLRKIPERCVLRLIGEMDESRIKEIILEEVDSALEALEDE